jgi:hypothetical protein
MTSDEKILSGLIGLGKSPEGTFLAIVEKSYLDKEYVDVRDLSGTLYTEVRKRAAVENSTSGILITPSEGSSVIVSRIESSDELFIEMFSDFQQITMNTGSTHLLIDSNGYAIEKGNENLGKCLEDLIDELNKIVIIYGNDINRPAMNLIKKRIRTILK